MSESEAKVKQRLRAERIAKAASDRLSKISNSQGEGEYKREIPASVLAKPAAVESTNSDPEDVDLALSHPVPSPIPTFPDPFSSTNPMDFSQMFAQQSSIPPQQLPKQSQTKTDRIISYLRVSSVLLLLFYSIVYWEPAQHAFGTSSWLARWSAPNDELHTLAGLTLRPIPFVAAFITLQATFFALQFIFMPTAIPSASKIASFAVYLPQPYSSYLVNLAKYWQAGLAAVSDACLVIFVLGLVSIYAQWQTNSSIDMTDVASKFKTD